MCYLDDIYVYLRGRANDAVPRGRPAKHEVPLVNEKSGPRMAYRIGMGVRHSDQNWKRELNRFIQENQAAIDRLLASYGVPLLDEQDKPIQVEP
jgi:hypothetical protein